MEKIFQLALQDPSLRLLTRVEWGSQESDHRNLIKAQLLNLKGSLFSSVSHAPECGGFALSQFPIGFDVEKTVRVRDDLAARISESKEVISAPDSASLWCAKEASFKALKNFEQPDLLSQIEIEFESKAGSIAGNEIWTFRIKNEKKFNTFGGLGAVARDSNHTYCIMIFRP